MIYLIVAAIVIALFFGFVALRSSEFRVTRSAVIAAPASEVFAQVNDFHKWEAWSPWARIDPAAKNTFEGPSAGTGAIFRWAGNSNVGEGGMTIIESKPHELIRIKLEFLKPFAGTNDVQFTFQPEGDKTAVTWSMDGKSNFICKIFSLFMSMDKMIGEKYEEGLASIKAIVEKPDTHSEPMPTEAKLSTAS